MTTILRVFVKPDGHNWLDLQLAEGQTPAMVVGVASREGVLIGPDFFVLWDSILFAATLTVLAPAHPKPTVVPFQPTPAWAHRHDDPPKDPA